MKYHFIGIKGSGMSALAQIIHDLGNEVQGSDVNHHLFTQDELKGRNIKILPFNPDNITSDMIVIVGASFREDHPEVIKAKELGVRIYSYSELLGRLSEQFTTIAVCGCHGKTTTTSLLTHIFNNIVGANYLIGDGTGFACDKNKYFIIEACEHKRHFLYYYPQYTIMTNIEYEHVDYYKDIDDMRAAYREFGNQTNELIIACGDDLNIRSIKFDKPVLYYGFNDDNDFIAKDVELSSTGSSFDVFYKGENIGHFTMPLFGKHMVLNTLAAISLCHTLNIDIFKTAELIKTFKGAKRRFKEKVLGDNVLIDDYAHHPTEVKVTIESARQKYPNKKIIAILKPNTYSRTKELYKDFIKVLNLADKAYVTDIFCDREKPEEWPGVTSELIINGLDNGEHISLETVNKLLPYNNSVLIFMSCKDIYVLQEAYEKLWNEQKGD